MGLPLPAYGIQLDINFDSKLVGVVVVDTSPGSPIEFQTVFEWAKLTEQEQSQFNKVVQQYGGTLPLAAPVAGYESVLLTQLSGSPVSANATGFSSSSTGKVYAVLDVDEVRYTLSIPEKRITTYADLLSVLNARLAGVATASLTSSRLTITSNSGGYRSSIHLVRSGDNNLFTKLAQFRQWGPQVPGADNAKQMMHLNHLRFKTKRVPAREPLYNQQRIDIINRIASSDLPFLSYLDTNGDGTGITDANQNWLAGSPLGPIAFKIAPKPGQFLVLNSLNVHYADGASFRYDGFGAQATPLTNGIHIQAIINGRMFVFTQGHPITQNNDWQHVASNVLLNSWTNPGDSLVAHMNIQSFGRPLMLNGSKGDELQVVLNDNLSFLDDLHFTVHGFQ